VRRVEEKTNSRASAIPNTKEVVTMKKKIYSRPVSVTLSECMFQQIYEIAEKEEVSMSEVIRDAIQEKLEKTKNEYNCK
jgi:metal-responsive CopG/Arc/MetJ family transcriptional regulator